jgi:LacI family transcriptional regulator
MSSTIALGVIKAIKEFGLSMPDDISLFGFDNNIFLDFLAVPLTTVAQPVEVIGEKVAEYLILSIKKVLNDEWKNITVEPKLIIRESV